MFAAAMMSETEGWTALGKKLASLMLILAVVRQYLPDINYPFFRRYRDRLVGMVYPYIHIKFPETTSQIFNRSDAYTAIEAYLATICTVTAKRFRADIGKDSTKLSLSMDDAEEVTDEFMGAKVWWVSYAIVHNNPGFSYFSANDEQRFYILSFHRRHRDLINDHYLPHVMAKGREAKFARRQRKLYSNNSSMGGSYYSSPWSHVPLEHPASFDTMAMDPQMKKEIIDDLLTFRGKKEYYAKIGRAWKRGYLLHGPPGTGKSTMVAAMANLLDYDIYDVELTAVANNTALRKLLINTSSKSVIVIEDIDCSLDLTGKRKKKTDENSRDGNNRKPPPPPHPEESKVTLSGLLNFIDGLWSSCAGERLIVFTTNHIEKLDQALIRKGRMDKHIELSYCCFEAFKVLAKNYLDLDFHPLFPQIQETIDESHITPADVAEYLMPKVQHMKEEDITECLQSLLAAIKDSKVKALKEAEEAAAAAAAAKAEAEEGEEEEEEVEEEKEAEATTPTTAPAHSPPPAASSNVPDCKLSAASSNMDNTESNKQAPKEAPERKKTEANGEVEDK